MNIEIINTKFELDIYGYSAIAINKDYAGTAFRLMDKMWKVVKEKEIKNKGLNIWVYEPGEKVFAGVELYEPPGDDVELEHTQISLTVYAYYKHIGPYHLIRQAGQNMRQEIQDKGFEVGLPYVEIYGHWTNDESKLETELLMAIK